MKHVLLLIALGALAAGCQPSTTLQASANDTALTSLSLFDVHGMFGGYNCFLRAKGKSTVQHVMPASGDGLREKRYEFVLSSDELRELRSTMARHRMEAVSIPRRKPVGCDSRTTLVISYSRPPGVTLSAWGSIRHERFGAVCGQVLRLCSKHSRGTPVYQGRHDFDWRPEGYRETRVINQVLRRRRLKSNSPEAGELLSQACLCGDLQAAEHLLKIGVAVDGTSSHGNTHLTTAAGAGHIKIIKLLIANGANLNAKGVLTWPVVTGEAASVAVLLEAGADPNVPNNLGVVPLDYALLGQKFELARLLWKRGGKLDIWTAAGLGQIGYLEAAIKKGASVDVQQARFGHTPLIYASRCNQVKTAHWLLSRGAKVDRTDTQDKKTPLHWAAWHGHVQVAKTLLASGATVNRPDRNGDAPMDIARIWKHTAVLALLAKHGGRELRKPPLKPKL
jgi:uncharacterized protein